MNIAIFGGTGRLGSALVEAALAAGYSVAVLVRDPTRIKFGSDRLRVIQGDARDSAAVERALAGAEAVLCALAPSAAGDAAARMSLSAATETIIAAMGRLGVRRLVASSAKAVPMPGDGPSLRFFALRGIVRLLAPAGFADTRRAAELVTASPLDWTLVRVDRVSEGPRSGGVLSGPVDARMRLGLRRADAADFMLRELAAREHLRRAPAICSRT